MWYFRAVSVAVFLMMMSIMPALAGDIISETVQGLRSSPVYIAPGFPGVSDTTAADLESILNPDDSLVLVMLPASATTELGVDPSAIAKQLSDKLGNQRIIGLVVGDTVVAYSPAQVMPSNIAIEQMSIAVNNSNGDPVTTLKSFAQYIHIWQAGNPHPKPKPIPPTKKGGISPIVWIAIVGLAVAIAGAIFAFLFTANFGGTDQFDESRTKFDAPTHVRDLLESIAHLRTEVNDSNLQQSIALLCRDTERYFKKYSSNKKSDAQLFEYQLADIQKVLTKYIEVQGDDSRYYVKPTKGEVLKDGKNAVDGLAAKILTSCQQGNAASLLEYTVNTKILSAQRYR